MTEQQIRQEERHRLRMLIQARIERHQQNGDVLRCTELRALLDQLRLDTYRRDNKLKKYK